MTGNSRELSAGAPGEALSPPLRAHPAPRRPFALGPETAGRSARGRTIAAIEPGLGEKLVEEVAGRLAEDPIGGDQHRCAAETIRPHLRAGEGGDNGDRAQARG